MLGARAVAGRVLAVAAIAALACRPRGEEPSPGPPPGEAWLAPADVERAGVVVERAAEQDIDSVLVTGGRVTFDEARVAHVLSPLSGRVVRIFAELGAHVRKGQALALIESPDLGSATSDLNKATAALIAAEHARRRIIELRQANAASEAALEQAENAWRQAMAERERAAQKVALLHAGPNVSQAYALTSPIEGDVLARNVTPGLNLQGTYSGGTSPELFTVGDLDWVWLMGDVYETDIARVREGAAVEVTVTGLPDTLHGKVDWISDVLDPQTRTARLRCVIPNPDGRLKPEMYGTVRVSVAPVRALAVPRTALVRLGEHTFVFLDRGASPDGRRRFERVPVSVDEGAPAAGPTAPVGATGAAPPTVPAGAPPATGGAAPWVPVTHGLEPGELVVVRGAQALSARL